MKPRCVVTVRRGREKPIRAGHPWVFSGAVKTIDGYGGPGDLCEVNDEKGRFLAVGYANTNSRITVRVLGLEEEAIDGPYVSRSLERAVSLRESLFGRAMVWGEKTAYRAVNAEGDFLPGLVVDRYGGGLVVQALTAGMQRLKGLFVDGLRALFKPAFIYEKVDEQMAGAEGMTARRNGLAESGCANESGPPISPEPGIASPRDDRPLADAFLHGALVSPLEIEENGARFAVDILEGQKTGFYLDQRRNRMILRGLAAGAEVLNCFCYTGAFGVQALLGGAERVRNVDISEKALAGADRNVSLNGIDPCRFPLAREDVFDFLRREERRYDVVILDPPKFAASKSELPGALRGYKDINLNALRRVKPGGLLMTFSCSGLVTEDLFQKVVFGAATDSSRSVQIVRRLYADADHPVNLAHREGEYLKGLLLRVV